MKTIGLIGGMSWESSLVYYRLINLAVKKKYGGFHSAECLLLSVDFAEIEALQHAGEWQALCDKMADAAETLEKAGAALVALCTNTMHLCSDAITGRISIPFLHIADATAAAIQAAGIDKAGLLGTRFTMEKDFYKEKLRQDHGIEVIVPGEQARQTVHDIIYNELVRGEIRESSREKFKAIIGDLEKAGAGGVILGCTEIPLLISPGDVDIPVFDTTAIHAKAAVNLALIK